MVECDGERPGRLDPERQAIGLPVAVLQYDCAIERSEFLVALGLEPDLERHGERAQVDDAKAAVAAFVEIRREHEIYRGRQWQMADP